MTKLPNQLWISEFAKTVIHEKQLGFERWCFLPGVGKHRLVHDAKIVGDELVRVFPKQIARWNFLAHIVEQRSDVIIIRKARVVWLDVQNGAGQGDGHIVAISLVKTLQQKIVGFEVGQVAMQMVTE